MTRWCWLGLPFALLACSGGVGEKSQPDSALVDTAVDAAVDVLADATDSAGDATETTDALDAVDVAETVDSVAVDSVAVDTFEPPVDADDSGALDTSYDGPLPAISIDDVSVVEGHTGEKTVTFNLSLSAAMPVPVSVQWATADGTAASTDYVTAKGKVVFGPGITNVPVDVKIVGDKTIEPDETFYVDLTTAVNATIARARGVATILDDDTAGPSITIADVTITEGDLGTKDANFVVTLSAAATKPVTVSWETVDGTARAAGTTTGETDFAPGTGTFSFAPGETTKTITVSVRSDTLDEPDEAFEILLSSPINGTLAKNRATATITDDDVAPTISVNDVSLTEGASGSAKIFVFEVTLSAASGRAITVDWSTVNGTAIAPSDYLASGGTLTFAPGDTKKNIGITVLGNNVVEPNETFSVALTTPTNATIAKASGTGTIVNDD